MDKTAVSRPKRISSAKHGTGGYSGGRFDEDQGTQKQVSLRQYNFVSESDLADAAFKIENRPVPTTAPSATA